MADDKAPMGSPLPGSSARPQLDLSGAAIQGNFDDRDPSILLPNQSDDISRLALVIGGSLLKLVYFSRHEDHSAESDEDKRKMRMMQKLDFFNDNQRSNHPVLGGRLHFVKLETRKLNECLDFISSNQLHCDHKNTTIKATGGGALKFAGIFKEKLGISLDKEDEIDCLVAGANF